MIFNNFSQIFDAVCCIPCCFQQWIRQWMPYFSTAWNAWNISRVESGFIKPQIMFSILSYLFLLWKSLTLKYLLNYAYYWIWYLHLTVLKMILPYVYVRENICTYLDNSFLFLIKYLWYALAHTTYFSLYYMKI